MQAEAIKESSVNQLPTSSPQLLANKWTKWFLVGVIVLITFITFSPALKNDFTNWDDKDYVLENNELARPIMENIKYFFSHYYFGNYSPITMITYALEYHLVGVKPELYIEVNIVIHLLNVMLVFWFIYLLSGKKLEVAAITSLFFGIHPMHVESVVWIGELKDVLYSFFFIGGLIKYYKYIECLRFKVQGLNSKVHYLLTFILFIISVLSKPAAITFPIVLVLLDFYTKRKFDKNVWFEKLPFFIVSFILGIITIKAEQQAHFINEYYTIFQRLLFAPYSMLNYIIKLFLPINLSAFYPYPQVVNGHLPYIFYITPLIAILLFYGVYLSFRYSRLILFGFLFFFVNIALVLKVFAFADVIIAGRYTYIPYIGLFFVIGMGVSMLYNNTELKLFVYKYTAVILIIILVITSSYLTYARCKIWKNSETLWTDVLNKFPNVPLPINIKEAVLYERGQYKEAIKLLTHDIQLQPDFAYTYINLANCYQAKHDYDNALKTIDIGLKYAPQYTIAINTKGAILVNKGQYKEAMKFFTEAIKLSPDYSDPYFNLANCYQAMHDYDNALKNIDIRLKYTSDDYHALNNKGFYLFKQGKHKEAMTFLTEAIKLKPDYNESYFNLADCYNAMHDYDNAIKIMDIILKNAPNDYKTLNHKGYILFEQDKYKEAMTFLTEAIKLQPDYSEAYFNLANCYNAMHDYDNAIKIIDIILKYTPNDYHALNNKGYYLFNQNKYKEAMKFLTEAIKLKPDYNEAYFNLANCYNAMHDYDNVLKTMDIILKYAPNDYHALNNKGYYLFNQGKYKEAVIFLEEAIKLKPDYNEAYFNLANCYNAMHDYDNAIKVMDIILKNAPDDYHALNNKGLYLFEEGKYKDAVRVYNEAIKLQPAYNNGRCFTLAECYQGMHDYGNAIKNMDIVLKNSPNDYHALNNKGYYLFEEGKYNDAVKFYNEAIEQKRGYSLAYINLAECYNAMHDYENVLRTMDIILQYAPEDYMVLNTKGYYLYEQGKYKEAVKFLRRAIQLQPDYSKAYINLAECYQAMHEYNSALEIIDIGLKNAPNNYYLLNNKGVILYNQGKYREAMKFYNEAIKLNPEYGDAYKNIGSCYGRLKDYDKAIFYWRRSLEFNTENAEIYKMLGWAYENKGDKISADVYYAKAKEFKK